MSNQVQWFPGHMSKTLQEFKNLAPRIDLFIVLLDARAPKSSWIDSFDDLVASKNKLVIFTKCDKVNRKDLAYWESYYNKKNIPTLLFDINHQKIAKKKIINFLDNQKSKKLIYKIVILGIPNVGKSTILNVLTDSKKAKVEDRAGVTKMNSWYQLEKKYWILDTPGVLQPKFENEGQGIILSSIGSIKTDILPLFFVSLELTKILASKEGSSIDLDIDNIEPWLQQQQRSSRLQERDFYKNFIKNFQKGKYGKLILDEKKV